jgi:hypothetical protein
MRGAAGLLCLSLALVCAAAPARADSEDLGGLYPPGFRPASVFEGAWAGAGSSGRTRPSSPSPHGRPSFRSGELEPI